MTPANVMALSAFGVPADFRMGWPAPNLPLDKSSDLAQFNADIARLRRDLVDYHRMAREGGG
jgi:hypothetical protein